LIKNSQPFGKKFQKSVGGDFFDSHCRFGNTENIYQNMQWMLLFQVQRILGQGQKCTPGETCYHSMWMCIFHICLFLF